MANWMHEHSQSNTDSTPGEIFGNERFAQDQDGNKEVASMR